MDPTLPRRAHGAHASRLRADDARSVPADRPSLARWLLDLADVDGRPVDDRLLFVPFSVSALNAQVGRRAKSGSLYRRINALAGVTPRDRGLLLEPAVLAQEAAGICVRDRLPCGPTRPEASSTTLAYAGGDGPLGGPVEQLAVSLSLAIEVLAPLGGDATAAAVELAAALVRLADRVEGLQLNGGGAGPAPSHLTPAQEGATQGATAAAAGARPERDGSATRARPGRDEGAGSRAVPPKEGEREGLSLGLENYKNLPNSLERRDMAGATQGATGGATGGATARPAEGRLSRAEVEELVGPLVETCSRRDRLGVTSMDGLCGALARFEAWQVRHAVELTCRLVNNRHAKTSIDSPVGWLISRANAGDRDYFPTNPPADAAPPRGIVLEAETPDPETVAAEETLAGLGVEEVAALDEWIRQDPRFSRSPGHLDRVFRLPGLLHVARIEVLRSRHAAERLHQSPEGRPGPLPAPGAATGAPDAG